MKNRKDRIMEYLKGMVSAASITDTKEEELAAGYIGNCIEHMDYFKRNPELCGRYRLKDDYLNRMVPYGLVKGRSGKTVVLTGHYDVVGVEEFGPYRELAFSVDQLGSVYRSADLDEESRADACSGEWLFGRGVADMKGGLSIGLAQLEEYGNRLLKQVQDQDGCILFLAVPDEESYSAGMRGAVKLLNDLREEHGLQYECLLDLEPNYRENGRQQVYIGSVGKCMPIIMVQGRKAHVADCFQGLSAVGVLGEFFSITELSPDFADVYEGEPCMPPTWLYFKDMKQEYDVSVPLRAYGAVSLLSFSSTPEEILEKLKRCGTEAVSRYLKKMERLESELLKKSGRGTEAVQADQKGECLVLGFGELLTLCREKKEGQFDEFYSGLYGTIKKEVSEGRMNYPQAAVEMMKAIMDYSEIAEPMVVIGFAPPYYPAYHSDLLPGREGDGSRYFHMACQAAEEMGLCLEKRNYFSGISDLSYCGAGKKTDMSAYSSHTPLWGELYTIDFEGIERLNLPALLLGPWSKGIHQRTERVNVKSLVEEVPSIIDKILEQVFAK